MRESQAPPPADPPPRRTRPSALLLIALILVFLIWYTVQNWGILHPSRQGGAATVAPGQTK